MLEPKVLLSGLGFPESPRWHEGRLWFCNWIDRQVMTVDTDGMAEVVLPRDPASHPMGYSIDWLPDGRLLTTGSTKPSRDFIYVEDAARGIIDLLQTDYTGTVNLGTGTMTTVREVVDVLEDVSGCPITDLGQPVSGPMAFRCDTATLERVIGWKPRWSIEDGVRATYEQMSRMKRWTAT